ncbi:MAG: hypothetical protein V4760_16730, partial [Bdellovibrionota bacterium]
AGAGPYIQFKNSAVTDGGKISSIDTNSYGMALAFNTKIGDGSAGTPSEERMRIDNNGYVGIGTTVPRGQLHVSGGASSSIMRVTNNGVGNAATDGFEFSIDTAGNSYLWNYENGPLLFGTNDLARMRILANGQITAGSGTAAVPTFSIFGDTDTGLYSSAAGSFGISTNGTKAIEANGSQYVTIGTDNWGNKTGLSNDVGLAGNPSGTGMLEMYTDGTGNYWGRTDDSANKGYRWTWYGSTHGTSALQNDLTLDFNTGGAANRVLTVDGVSRYVGIGTTTPVARLDVNQVSAGSMAIQATNNGTSFFKVLNPAGGATNSWNAANAVMYVGRDTGTSRSINAAGSINATGADFAEWVPWTSASPKPEAGSLIKYKKTWVVVSSKETAAFIGNDTQDEANSILIAFVGQVPVKVKGPVKEGDLIIPMKDGYGIAVDADEATFAQYKKAVGTAWEASTIIGVKKVKVAVGIK